MICPTCGKETEHSVISSRCTFCGAQLGNPPPIGQKDQRLAVVLNLIPLSTGYLYLDQTLWWITSVCLGILAAILGIIIFFWVYSTGVFCVETAKSEKGGTHCVRYKSYAAILTTLLAALPYLAVRLYAACDAWQIAERENTERKRLTNPDNKSGQPQ